MITKKGIVSAAKMTGTVTVTVHRAVRHPLYKKSYRVSKKFLVDTAGKEVGLGDEVLIVECRPVSKRKHFRILEILKQAPRVSELGEEAGLEEAMHRTKTKVTEETQGTEEKASPASSL